ncbi:putative LRR receptor-like serine/threonine-protein kinase [Cinnamomum micranthum f. kanehirae]|uniref:non-specific serine/threonine protein kinase n=1 Tax=Cinnamomum micranthum f. kanehirae TaxID=337451 RepID=A0A3S4NJV3_9MAGN|nr:putative LRR receptor-like serine/threonine-protein kinase [Cinnamomum micranthum f. kanehirae]
MYGREAWREGGREIDEVALEFLIMLVVLAHAQPSFISLDCGTANGSNYREYDGITYISDAQFIQTGVNEVTRISPGAIPSLYSTVRSFPHGNRNCYNLGPVHKSNKYLIRACFLYGDYDGKNSTPKFDLYIGANKWRSIYFSDATYAFYVQIITVATMNFISVCLVNTGTGTPFISGLELRPLNSSTYGVVNESQSLRLWGPFDIGRSINNSFIRYPDDPFDLIWRGEEDSSWISFRTLQNVTNKDGAIEPLSMVMMTAVYPINDSDTLYYSWTADNSSQQFLVNMHFAELQLMGPNMTREFTVCCGNNSCYNSPIRPEYLVTTTIQTPQPLTGQFDYSCSIKKTPTSTLPPILNAIEIFTIVQLPTTPTREEDVEAMFDIKAAYKMKRNWMGDPCLPEIYKWEGLTCNNTHSDAPAIVSLNLSSAGLKGKIAAPLANLKSILSLDLSWNNLTGPVPDFLGDLPFLSSLNLSGNQLCGLIPSNLIEKSKKGSLKLSLDGNPDLCVVGSCNRHSLDGDPDLCVPGSRSRHSNKRKITILIAASVASVVILSILLIILRRFKWRKEDPVVKPNKAGDLFSSEKRRFTYAEVVAMTNNFKRAIGKGGFGTVYHGQMPDGTQVAVKMLSLQSVKLLSHMRQGSEEFQNEVQLLIRVHHRNLVPFIGYCQEGDGTALIYEYMAQGNLGSHLLGTNGNTKALNWGQRLRIALDIAQGLEYLHTGCKPSIIHRDMKTTNILLNERFEAKIGDFGLSKVFFKDDEQTYVSTVVKGTPGYLDPEYCHSNNLTQKSDVYGFGVVLLELITGQPPIIRSNTNYEKKNLVDWATPIIVTRDIQAVLDPRLEGDYDANSLSKVAEIALACTSPTSIERPTMTDIVAVLKDCLGTETPAEISCSLEIEQVESTPTSSFSSQPLPR